MSGENASGSAVGDGAGLAGEAGIVQAADAGQPGVEAVLAGMTRGSGFANGASAIGSSLPGYPGPEQAEEDWIDQNSVPLIINRYNGTLIRGE